MQRTKGRQDNQSRHVDSQVMFRISGYADKMQSGTMVGKMQSSCARTSKVNEYRKDVQDAGKNEPTFYINHIGLLAAFFDENKQYFDNPLPTCGAQILNAAPVYFLLVQSPTMHWPLPPPCASGRKTTLASVCLFVQPPKLHSPFPPPYFSQRPLRLELVVQAATEHGLYPHRMVQPILLYHVEGGNISYIIDIASSLRKYRRTGTPTFIKFGK